MVFRPKDCLGCSCNTHSVSARLAYLTPNLADTISDLANVRVRGWSGSDLARHRVTARRVLRPAAFGPHGATSVADVRGSAADSAWRAISAAPSRVTAEIRARRGWTLSHLAGVAESGEHDYT